MTTLLNYSALRNFSTYTDVVFVEGYATIGDGGEGFFFWDNNVSVPDDDGIVIKPGRPDASATGAWIRTVDDVVKSCWFGAKNTESADAAVQIKNTINAAIRIRGKVSLKAGIYLFDTTIEIDIPDNFHLIIEGNGALIKASPKVTGTLSEVNLIRFFTSAGVDTRGTGIFMDSLYFDGGVVHPQFTEPDINAIKRIHALVVEDIYAVSIRHCSFKNIQGTGTRIFNFVMLNIKQLAIKNVGGKFHAENDFDSFGDGIYLCQKNLETLRPTRKFSHATIADCQIFAYDPLTNGNFVSRCGICIEGFGTINSDHRVYLTIDNSTIAGYDRTFHVEGIDAEVTAGLLNINHFQSIYSLTSARSKSSFNNCKIMNRLADNPNQVRLGNGGVMTYSSNLPNHILFNQCHISPNGNAVFIGQFEFLDTVLDYSNYDVFFENSTISINKSRFINIPHKLPKGFNCYSCTFSALNSTIQGYKNGQDNSGGTLHFENLVLQSFNNNIIIDTRLIFTFRPSVTNVVQLINNKIYRNPKGTGSRMDALINFNNIQQVKMSNNEFFIEVATAADEEPIYQTYGVQSVTYNKDTKSVHILNTAKTLNNQL